MAKGAQLLVQALEQEGVEVVFGYPGGAIMPVYDALVDSGLLHVLARHEQGAVLAADGYARVTGRPGVCMATSGPGATNLITGIANAYLDSVPVVAITGQVPTALMGTDAFQEGDIFGMTSVQNLKGCPSRFENGCGGTRIRAPGGGYFRHDDADSEAQLSDPRRR